MTAARALDESTFPGFVADLWERQGWATQIRSVDGEHYVAAVRPEAGERGLIWAKSGSTGARVDADGVASFATFCEENGVDDAAILTLGAFTEDGEAAAEKFGIALLDGDGLSAVIERHDLEAVVTEHAPDDAGSGDGGSNRDGFLAPLAGLLAAVDGALQFDALESPSELVSTIRERVDERGIELPRQVGVATVVVVALVVAGVVVAPSFGPSSLLGGGNGEGASGPMEVSAGPVQPDGASTTLYVEYNATTKRTIDADPGDDRVHVAPNGTRFVIVGLSIVNTGNQPTTVRPATFTLSANGTTYNYQPLAGVDGFAETNLSAGDSHEGWTVFVVPEDAPSGTLGIDQGAVRGGVAAQFGSNPGLTINVTA